MRMTRSRVALSIAAALVAGVLTPASTAPAVAAETVTLDAQVASNAKGAFEELTKQFQVKHPNVQVEAKYLGGATIGKAIDAGTPIDVVLVGSSITDKETQFIDPVTPILRNKEMILVPKSNPANIHSLKDLGNPGVKLSMGTPTSAVGKLASTVIQNAAADYGFDWVTAVRKNILVSSEKGSDVVAAIGLDCNAGITFASDINPARFLAIPIDDKYNVVSTYVMTVTKNAKNAALGRAFVAMVASPQGQATLRKFNYMSPH